jgi:branched-chain amino acid transport system ATP-binding protein
MSLLELADVSVVYGGVAAVDSVTLAVEEGTVTGLIGPNGAGKTTMIDAVTGFAPTASGTITFGGRRIDRLAPHRRAAGGLARTFQSLELFEDLTVRENLLVAADRARWWSPLVDVVAPRRREPETLAWALDLFGLSPYADRLPAALSHGQRKRVGIARALVASPRLVLLDEPAAGLDTAESAQLGTQLLGLPEHGITVFLIDHDMGLVLSVCETVAVIDFGTLIAIGPPDAIRTDEAVIKAYLGEQARQREEGAGTPVVGGAE